MNQIVCALYALGFVQLVISQGCSDAQSALTANATCTTAFTSRDVSVFCVGSCRTLFDNAINNCDNPTVASYSDVIDIFCTPCEIAQDALTSNNCIDPVTDSDIICMGTCRTLFDNAINGCDNATGSSYSGLIDAVCSPCSMAIEALSSSNTSCIVIDPDILCMGTCRTLFDTVISSCDNETASAFSGLIDAVCRRCRMAQVALLSSNISCFDTTDSNILCMGTCRTLYDTVISSCDNETAYDSSIMINTLCTPCGLAQVALSSNSSCIGATDPNIACMGTCRSLYDSVINSCDNETASTISTVLNSLCDGSDTETACQTVGEVVDDSCFLLLLTTNPSVCSGICGFQVSIAATACASSSDSEIQGYISAYNTACFSGPVCTAALQAFSADRECISAFFNNDIATYCSGTCGALIETVFDSCPNDTYYSRGKYNRDCGITGSGNVLQGSVIITLLLVAVCIFIM